MKSRMLIIFAALLTLSACSGDGRNEPSPVTEQEQNMRLLLDGKFHGERTWGNITECEDVEFLPYDSPRTVKGFFGTFTAYGIALTNDYIGGNAPTATYRNYYSLDTSKEPFTLSFYRCNEEGSVTDREDKRTIEAQSFDLFLMRPYGTTAENNKTYKRQQ